MTIVICHYYLFCNYLKYLKYECDDGFDVDVNDVNVCTDADDNDDDVTR